MTTAFVIDRARWANGGIICDSGLHTSERKMCCLGFYARACGLKIKQIHNKSYPHEIDPLPTEMLWLRETPEDLERSGRTHPFGSQRAYAIANTNDQSLASDLSPVTRKEREQLIRAHFAAQDIKVSFTGRYPARVKAKKGA